MSLQIQVYFRLTILTSLNHDISIVWLHAREVCLKKRGLIGIKAIDMGGSVSKTQEGCRILTLVSFTILQSNRLCMEKFKLYFALEVKMLLHEC